MLWTGEVLGFENLVLGIFDFVHALIETPRHRSLMKKYIEQLLYYVFHYMQMTEEQVRVRVLHRFSFGFLNIVAINNKMCMVVIVCMTYANKYYIMY